MFNARKGDDELDAVRLTDVSMMFNLSTEKVDNLKEYIIRAMRRSIKFEEFWALKNISVSIKKGDSLGVVGLNGSGKSTLLKLVAGVLKPTKGKVITNGQISPLIELGAGFDPDLSARENVFLNGAILGYSKAYIAERLEEIIEFSEIQEFIDVPIKNFSSGMTARLGFAIATMNIPEILIIDEILAVGDFKFQEKSFKRMETLLSKGATVMFVSHSDQQIRQICNRAIWLRNGELVMEGPSDEVCNAYKGQ